MSDSVCTTWTEAFRPIKSKKIIVDAVGESWTQITALGWERDSDKFFWPGDPTNTDNMMNSLPHTVDQVAIMRNRMTAKN